jgi:ectoine hydroxylase-related dioxygenase (phytanoyl-CoA dioxygenase family)
VLREAQEASKQSSHLDRNGLSFKHNVFKHSQKLRDFVASEKVVHLLRDIIGPDFWIRWDQTVEKQPGGAPFPWHQDNGYNGLSEGHFQLWVAVSKMTKENGGLWVQRGSHVHGKLPHSKIGTHVFNPGNEADAVFIDAEPGDAVVFSSFLLHKTEANTTQAPRLAYVVEYMKLGDFDPSIDAPYFVVARHGEPAPRFEQFFPHRLKNQLKRFKLFG